MRSGPRSLASLAFLCLLVLGFVSPLALRAATWGDFTYTVSNNQVTITSYTGAGGAVSMPDQISGVPIKSIGPYAFENCTSLTTLTLPSGLVAIGPRAFAGCSNLTSMIFPAGLTSIESYAFNRCSSLVSIMIPSTVTSVGEGSFSSCSNLTAINVEHGNAFYASSGGVLFNKTATTLLQAPGGLTGTYSVPSSATSIGPVAFAGCSLLAGITLPPSVASIGYYAFYDCRSLNSIAIPSGVTSIGHSAFSYCYSLTGITLPFGLTSIENFVFRSCSSLTSINIPSSVSSINHAAFFGCASLSSITIPASVSSIDQSAFMNCSNLAAINVEPQNGYYSSDDGVLFDKTRTRYLWAPRSLSGAYAIPSGVTFIGNHAFSGHSGLLSITLPSSVTYIGQHAFSGCPALTSITLSSGLTTIDYSAFWGCSGLTSLTIPASVVTINDEAFENCNNLISVTFLGNIPSMRSDAFYHTAPNLRLYYQPGASGFSSPEWDGIPCYLKEGDFDYFVEDGAATLGAYSGTDNTVTVPGELGGLLVARIGAKAFHHRDSLTSVVFPANLAAIGDSAFADCANLSWVRFAGAAPALGVGVFDSAAAGFAVHYPQGTSGFTSPIWSGYPARPFNSAQSFISFPALPARPVGTRFALKASVSSGLPVSFLVVSGPATLGADGRTVTLGAAAGAVTIRALQPGGVRNGIAYAAAAPIDRTFRVTPTPATQAQAITFAQPPAATYGDAPMALAASASSGLPVSLELVASAPAGIANLGDSSLTILGAGRIIVKATQTGSETYKAAKPVLRVVTINKAPLAVSFRPVTSLVGQATGAVFEPVFGAEADGGSTLHDFMLGDTAADLAPTRPLGRCRATNSSPAGQYPISAVGGLDANYRFVAGQSAQLTLAGFGGGYEVLLVDVENEYPRGKLSVLVAYNSLAYTGVLELASEPAAIPIRGALSATDGSAATGAWARPGAVGVAALSLSFTIKAELGYLVPTLTSGPDTISPYIYSGPSRIFVQETIGRAKLPSPWTGTYTSIHIPREGLGTAELGTPRGAGHAWVSVSANGTMSIKGKLGDGSILTTSSPCAPGWPNGDDRWANYRIFARPYGRRLNSLIFGEFELSANHGRGEGGWFWWQKAPSPSKPVDSSYREGFETVRWATMERWHAPSAKSEVKNGKVVPAATLVQRLFPGAASGDSAVLAIDFTDRSAFGARAEQIPSSFKLGPTARISDLLPATTPANVSGFTLRITPAIGAFSGSFILSDQVSPPPAKPVTRKASFSGSLLQNPNAPFLGYGHVLFDPVPGDTDANADALVSHEIILNNL